MDSEYSPCPSTEVVESSFQTLSLQHAAVTKPGSPGSGEPMPITNGHKTESTLRKRVQATKSILNDGDVVIEYAFSDLSSSASSEAAIHRWQVSSEDLMQNSPYFRALLDPDKFSEGRHFLQQKTIWSQKTARNGVRGEEENASDVSDGDICQNALPTVSLPGNHFISKLGVDAIELFLRILCLNSLEDEKKQSFNAEIRLQPTSLIARLVEIADVFNSPRVVREALQGSRYAFGKGKFPFSKFDPSILKMSEDRIRQTIFIARFLDDESVFQISTHTLIVLGSKSWINGIENPTSDSFRWRYFPDGLEEELYYRRQCVLNTITDLQAYFLRAYGALEEDVPDTSKPTTINLPGLATTIQPRQFQCRYGFGNSSACDVFHLGQITRFFALRTKTIFLGSSLIDPDFSLDTDSEDPDNNTVKPSAGPPSDITAIISSLKQCPDYQIDSNHIGCGVRRRLLPPLDCIERFIGDSRGLLGIALRSWDGKEWPLASGSWANRSLRRAKAIGIHFSRVNSIYALSPGGVIRPDSQEETGRLLFTAKKRDWES